MYNRRRGEFLEYYNLDRTLDLSIVPDFHPNYWRVNCRISKGTFDYLCFTVHDCMVKGETQLRETITVPERVAISLWWLAHGGSYTAVGQSFGVSSSIVGRIKKFLSDL